MAGKVLEVTKDDIGGELAKIVNLKIIYVLCGLTVPCFRVPFLLTDSAPKFGPFKSKKNVQIINSIKVTSKQLWKKHTFTRKYAPTSHPALNKYPRIQSINLIEKVSKF